MSKPGPVNTNELRAVADRWIAYLTEDQHALLYSAASELDALRTERNLAAKAAAQKLAARPIETAPRNGQLLRLLVDYTVKGSQHPLADAEQAWTVGFNNLDADGRDEWQIAGWCWSHDHFTEGNGHVIGWLPFHPEAEDVAV